MNRLVTHMIVWLSLVSVSCAGHGGSVPISPTLVPSDAALGNALFSSAQLIQVGTPTNSCFVGLQPTFTWKATGNKLVYVGVFVANIDVSSDSRSIVNTTDNVWAWHTGLGTAREGNVRFQDGVDVKNGVPVTGPPTPLQEGQRYAWAVWAWDSAGLSISQSSQEIVFSVDSTRQSECN